VINLNSRLKKARIQLEKSRACKDRVIFVRLNPEVMEDTERHFREENPDFDGEIFVYTLGTKNLNPYVSDGRNERS
jgi:hypothetical protein